MRNKLICKLANLWRNAENIFIETEDDKEKVKTLEYQNSKNLTKEEEKELNDILVSMGV